eukprot:PhM_4_TR1702/c1_g1_i2/m.34389
MDAPFTTSTPGLRVYMMDNILSRARAPEPGSAPRLHHHLPVFVGNIPHGTPVGHLAAVVRYFTNIPLNLDNVHVHYRPDGRPRGSATVWVSTPQQQRAVVELNGRICFDGNIKVHVSTTAARMKMHYSTIPSSSSTKTNKAKRPIVFEMPRWTRPLPPLPTTTTKTTTTTTTISVYKLVEANNNNNNNSVKAFVPVLVPNPIETLQMIVDYASSQTLSATPITFAATSSSSSGSSTTSEFHDQC